MKTLTTYFPALISFLLVSCGVDSLVDNQSRAQGRIARANAKNYFKQPRQVELANAVANGNVQKINELVSGGAKINQRGEDDITPLAWALIKKSKTGFETLLIKGADPNINLSPPSWKTSVMEISARHPDSDYLKLALKHGGNSNLLLSPQSKHYFPDDDPNLRNMRNELSLSGKGKSLIFASIVDGRVNNVRLLIAHGANLNHRDAIGHTPARQAAGVYNFEIVHLLLKSGANPSLRDRNGRSLRDHIKQFSWRIVTPRHKQYTWLQKVRGLLKL